MEESLSLAQKITQLIRERGWNQEDFARIAGINRHTVRQLMNAENGRRLRNATVSQCAKAFGISVHELHELPLKVLLDRMRPPKETIPVDSLHRQSKITQQELAQWCESHPERMNQLSDSEFQELLLLQGPESPFMRMGVEPFVQLLERRRKLIHQVTLISRSEYLDLLEQMIDLLFDKMQRTGNRG